MRESLVSNTNAAGMFTTIHAARLEELGRHRLSEEKPMKKETQGVVNAS